MDEDEAAIQAEDFQGNIPKEAGFADPRVDITVMASSTFSHLQPSAADPEAGHGSETGADVAAAAPALLGVQADNRRPEMGVRSITGEAMSSSTDGLVLYDLTSKPGSHQAFSPHVSLKAASLFQIFQTGADSKDRVGIDSGSA